MYELLLNLKVQNLYQEFADNSYYIGLTALLKGKAVWMSSQDFKGY